MLSLPFMHTFIIRFINPTNYDLFRDTFSFFALFFYFFFFFRRFFSSFSFCSGEAEAMPGL